MDTQAVCPGRVSPTAPPCANSEVPMLCLMVGLTFFGAGPLQQFLSPYLKRAGHGEFACGALLTALYASQAMGRFSSGMIVPRLGLKTSILAGLGGYVMFPAAAAACVVLSPSLAAPAFAVLVVAAVAWGFVSATFWTATQSHLLNCSTSDRYGRNHGLQHLALQVGILAGLLALSAIAGRWEAEPSSAFVRQMAAAAAACLAGLLLAFTLCSRSRAGSPKGVAHALRLTFRRDAIALGFILLPCGASYGVVLNGLNRMVGDRFGEPAFFRMLCGFYLATGILSYVGGRLSDRVGRSPALTAALVLGAIGAGCAVASRQASEVPAALLIAVAGLFLGALFGLGPTVITAWVGDRTDGEDRPQAIAAAFVWRDLGIALGVQVRAVASMAADPAVASFAVLAVTYLLLAATMPLIRGRLAASGK